MKPDYSLRIIISILVLWSGLAQAGVSVSVDRNPVSANETFQLIFEADQSVDSDPDFSPLQQHFQILNRSQSNNISIVNGKYQRNLKWTLQVMSRQPGNFMIPAIYFGQDKTEPFELSVEPANQTNVSGGKGLVFEVNSDTDSLYVQSQALITMRLLTDSNISAYQMGELVIPDMDVVIEPLGEVKQYQTRIDNKPWLVLERKFSLFPQQSGTMNIGPILAEVRYGTRSRSVFDPFPNSGELRRVSARQLVLEVKATPDSFNQPHWLPSTDVQLTEDWQGDLNQLTAGEPLTRIISLSVEGQTAAQLPDLVAKDIQGIKQYPDQPVSEDRRSAKGINGLRQQRIAIIPTTAGRYTLPEITIPWWNVDTNRQEMARIPARSIEVKPAIGAATASPSGQAPAPQYSGESSRPSDAQSGSGSFWMWVSLTLMLGWISTAFAWWLTRRRNAQPRKASPGPTRVSPRAARKRLHQACINNDASDARNALPVWANAIIPDRHFSSLDQVTRYFGNPLKQQVDLLNQGIYGTHAGDWDGTQLWQACEQISAASQPATNASGAQGLQPLNP